MLDFGRNVSVQSVGHNYMENKGWEWKGNMHCNLYHLKSNTMYVPPGKGYLTSVFPPWVKNLTIKWPKFNVKSPCFPLPWGLILTAALLLLIFPYLASHFSHFLSHNHRFRTFLKSPWIFGRLLEKSLNSVFPWKVLQFLQLWTWWPRKCFSAFWFVMTEYK